MIDQGLPDTLTLLRSRTFTRPKSRCLANSDSGAYAYAHSAIDQAGRAMNELIGGIAGFATFPGPPLAPGDLAQPGDEDQDKASSEAPVKA